MNTPASRAQGLCCMKPCEAGQNASSAPFIRNMTGAARWILGLAIKVRAISSTIPTHEASSDAPAWEFRSSHTGNDECPKKKKRVRGFVGGGGDPYARLRSSCLRLTYAGRMSVAPMALLLEIVCQRNFSVLHSRSLNLTVSKRLTKESSSRQTEIHAHPIGALYRPRFKHAKNGLWPKVATDGEDFPSLHVGWG